jgi:CheY-like chemotaxis protein
LYFPQASAPEAPPQAREKVEVHDGSGEVILLVEDEPDLVTLAARLLADLGYRVICAANGADALEIARRESRIDLLLTDIVMPGGMSGRRLAQQLRVARPGIPVVYVSGYADDDVDSTDAIDGAIVAKPYDRSTLAAAVSDALRAPV